MTGEKGGKRGGGGAKRRGEIEEMAIEKEQEKREGVRRERERRGDYNSQILGILLIFFDFYLREVKKKGGGERKGRNSS